MKVVYCWKLSIDESLRSDNLWRFACGDVFELNGFKNSFYHLGDVLCVDAVDGVAHILLGGDDQTEGEHAGGGDAVVQPEHPAVDVAVRDVQEAPQLPEYLQHLESRLSCSAFLETAFSQAFLGPPGPHRPYQLSSPITFPGRLKKDSIRFFPVDFLS